MPKSSVSRCVAAWFAFATPFAARGVAQIITTVAGTSVAFPSQSLAAINAPLGFVSAVAVDSKGNVYTADFSNNLVSQTNTNGILTVVAGNGIQGFSGDGGPAISAALNSPTGVAVDSAGNLYIADSVNDRIRKVSGGIITTLAGNGTAGFLGDGGPATSAMLNAPGGVAADSAGNVYIADTNNNVVRKVSGGIITTFAGNGTRGFLGDGGVATSAELRDPAGVAVDSTGNLYIADSGNDRVRRVSAGIIRTIAGNGTSDYMGNGEPATGTGINAAGVAVDSAGSVYIADGLLSVYKVSGGTITILAGTGEYGFSGDGGPATKAVLSVTAGVAVDSTGNVYIADHFNSRVRKVSGGIINTIAGTGKFSGDGGAAILALLDLPFGIALDSTGALYIADTFNNRIRKVSGGMITTIAGNGAAGFSGDTGPAVSAALNLPSGIAVDSTGAVYIADTNNNVVRKVSGGIITTIAGNGGAGSSGDGDQARGALLSHPFDVAVDSAGNVYISEYFGHRVRKVSGGIITTVAGIGMNGFSGDGPATNVELNSPAGLALDSAGNLYIADSGNNRIRKLSAGIITTIAGNGSFTFSGDGGPAASAGINGPFGVALDASGSIYISGNDDRVRKITDGIITTIAGNGGPPSTFSGDGGPATSAPLFSPAEVGVDSAGNVYIADTGHNRIRKVQNVPASFQASPTTLSFTATAGAAAAAGQTIKLIPSVAGLPFSLTTNAPWLSATPTSGAMPASLQVTADASQLTAGAYKGVITITAPNAAPSTLSIPVTFTVSPPLAGSLAVSATSLPFSFTQGAGPATLQVTISNLGSGSIRYMASASTSSGGNWLSLSSAASVVVTPTSPASLAVSATPGSLAVGSYSGTITVSSPDTGQQIAISVTLAISAPPRKILLSQVGFAFTAVAQGGTVLPQSLGILNTGSGTLNYSVQTTTQPGASGPAVRWLTASPRNGTTVARPFLDVSFVDVTVDAHALAAGAYYGQITVSADGASNSPQTAVVILTVLPAGSNPGPAVAPTGLIFTGVAGAESPGSQNVTVANLTANPATFTSNLGAGSAINYLPTNFTVMPDTPVRIVVQPDISNLTAGPHYALLTAQNQADGSYFVVNILIVVAPAGTLSEGAGLGREGPRAGGSCVPTKVIPQFKQVGFGSSATLSLPTDVEVDVVNDCGTAITDGSVVVSFSNGDPPLSLVSLQNGSWTTSWLPNNLAGTVTLSAQAQPRAGNLSGTTQTTTSLQQGSQLPPVLAGLSLGPFAPGDLMLLKGIGLADGQAAPTSAPLPQQLAGVTVTVGDAGAAPLLFADKGEVVALVPSGVSVNTTAQVTLQRDNALTIAVPAIITPTHPIILTKDGSAQGQGLIYAAATLADTSNPVKAGDTIVVYCTGLGTSDANGNATNPVQLTIGGQPAQVSYAGIALAANYPPAGAPTALGGLARVGLGGLYQITATVPGGLFNGTAPIVITSAGQTSSAGVTLAISGPIFTGPVITSVNTAYGSSNISQNDFIEIHGSNLAASTAGPASLIMQLGGVTVSVNGKPALLYYVSPTQINALTPLDGATGPVPVVVTGNGASSASFTANLQPATPAFLLFDAGKHITATHADGSLLGPASLGTAFTPGAPGETIIAYGVGFGLPSTALVGGSATQTGSLPSLPVCRISGLPATVAFAGLNGYAGLYQMNIVIPSSAASGDNPLSCVYGDQNTPVGTLLSVKE